MYNKVFLENRIPIEDILFIYILYFHIIKHEIISQVKDRERFWKECCRVMLKESKGKTGNMIADSLKGPYEFDSETLYKIYRIIGHNMQKINPNFYSKICGTTGLIVFFIKDMIDYMGFTFEKKTPISNVLTNMNGIVKAIDYKRVELERFVDKFYGNC